MAKYARTLSMFSRLSVVSNAGDPVIQSFQRNARYRPLVTSAKGMLKADGSLIVLVPQGKGLFGSIDRTLGHHQRFDRTGLLAMLQEQGLAVKEVVQLNKIGTPAWWFYGNVLGRKRINKVTLKIFDKTVWVWRLVDRLLPWRGLSLVVVAVKR